MILVLYSVTTYLMASSTQSVMAHMRPLVVSNPDPLQFAYQSQVRVEKCHRLHAAEPQPVSELIISTWQFTERKKKRKKKKNNATLEKALYK